MTSVPAPSAKPKKARMLVVDDEPDNLDLLYRTFRRDFNVLRAESGQQALDVLAEHGEVAVIISDQRMPEMKGTEFLSKTVPEFPDTVRIILTGFTDVEDLVDAINAGQVYRYITKPWDPEELKRVVQRAADTYEVLKQRGDAIQQLQVQQNLVAALANIPQTVEDTQAAMGAIAIVLQETLLATGCAVHEVTGEALGDQVGTAGTVDIALLKGDTLVTDAIAQKTLQLVPQASAPGVAEAALYESAGIQAHCLAPVVFREVVVAVISLQWQSPQEFSESTLQLIQLAAKQVGLTLNCL
jgi:response regulator RpfG family c-di-GMP phosphodiesterase